MKVKKIFLAIYRYAIFFALIGFVLTCNVVLFLELLRRDSGIVYTNENVHFAALFTFWNAAFLSLVCAIFDYIRRKISVEKPVERILNATQRITKGDFSVRIEPTHIPTSMNEFNPIIKDLNQMAQELSGIEALRSDFISNVSHELKTPLAVLQNYGTLLEQPDLPENQRIEYAKSIIRVSNHLSELITNILKLNKLENQNIYPNISKVCLNEQLCECLLAFENEWEIKNIEIETDIKEDVFINTDAELLSIVWNNLFSNALKFTDEGGKISVSLTEKNGAVEVAVKDTGCGMSAETGKHIFEKFYQGDTSHATKGNGLGLALVKRVVDILHGEISVESVLNKGTTFTVRFKTQ